MDDKGSLAVEHKDAPPPSYEDATAQTSSIDVRQSQQQDRKRSVPVPVGSSYQSSRSLQHIPTTSSSGLQKPIAIPATSKKLGSPFLRAYPPALEQFELSKEDFLQFIDDLNRIAVASPPIQVLGLAGSIVSMVPIGTAQIVGGAVNAASVLGAVAISKGRTEVFLRAANRDIFRPRGLKVEVAKLDAIAKLTGMPILNEQQKVDKHATVLGPVDDCSSDDTISGQDRRLSALEPWIAQLDLTPLPNIQERTNPLSKLNAAASERQRNKEETKMLKDRSKAVKHFEKDSRKADKDYEKEMRKIEKEERKIQSKEKPEKVQKELAKLDKERAKVEREYEKEMHKVGKDRHKDDKEEEGVRKILWLIIRSLNAVDGPGPNPYIDSDGDTTSGTSV